MPAAPYIRSFVRGAIAAGQRPTETLRAFRAAGGRIGNSEWFELWGQAQGQLALAPSELQRPLNRVPQENETYQETTTKLRPGYVQHVKVFGRQRSGTVVVKDVPVFAGRRPMSRVRAIQRAEEWARGFFSQEGPRGTDLTTVYGGIYVGTAYRVRAT